MKLFVAVIAAVLLAGMMASTAAAQPQDPPEDPFDDNQTDQMQDNETETPVEPPFTGGLAAVIQQLGAIQDVIVDHEQRLDRIEDELNLTENDTVQNDTVQNDTLQDEDVSVTFDDQESRAVVTVNTTVPDGGYVAIHNETLLDENTTDAAIVSTIGVSQYLEPGTHDDVVVDVEADRSDIGINGTNLTENQTLIAMPHQETTGDETFDFVTSNGTDDGPYVDDDGEPVTDTADITVPADTEADTLTAETTGNDTEENDTLEQNETGQNDTLAETGADEEPGNGSGLGIF